MRPYICTIVCMLGLSISESLAVGLGDGGSRPPRFGRLRTVCHQNLSTTAASWKKTRKGQFLPELHNRSLAGATAESGEEKEEESVESVLLRVEIGDPALGDGCYSPIEIFLVKFPFPVSIQGLTMKAHEGP